MVFSNIWSWKSSPSSLLTWLPMDVTPDDFPRYRLKVSFFFSLKCDRQVSHRQTHHFKLHPLHFLGAEGVPVHPTIGNRWENTPQHGIAISLRVAIDH